MSLLLTLIACSQNEFTRVTTTDTFSQAPSNQVDILWVIDNSVSMADEQASVAVAAEAFLHELEVAGMDFQLGVITTDLDDDNPYAGVLVGSPNVLTSACLDDGDNTDCTYAADFVARVDCGIEGADKEKGLQAIVSALSPPLVDTRNAGFLRPDAMLMVVVLSDENDCSDDGALGGSATGEACYRQGSELVPVANLVRDLKAAKPEADGGVVLNGIIGPESGCLDAFYGKRYATAIAMLGGAQADICLADYAGVMGSLGLAATGIRDTFQLSHAADPEEIEVAVTPPDAEAYVVPEDELAGWSYLADYAQIRFNGDSVPPRGAVIEVTYYAAGPAPEGAAEETSATSAPTAP